jgi:hypothetical protein
MSQQTQESSRFALVAFLNYEPIQLQDEENALYIEVSNDTAYTRIPVEVTPNLPLGRYDLIVMRISNPRVPLCVARGPEGDITNTLVRGWRVSVEVQSP